LSLVPSRQALASVAARRCWLAAGAKLAALHKSRTGLAEAKVLGYIHWHMRSVGFFWFGYWRPSGGGRGLT
jgi:hypothetical protein